MALLISFALRWGMLSLPFERDEGGYAYVAGRLCQGDRLYVDVISDKPPAIYPVYALALYFQKSHRTVRAVLIPLAVLTALLFYLLVNRWHGPAAAGVATAIFTLARAAPAYYGFSPNLEIFMTTTIVAALLCLPKDDESATALRFVGCGALLALASLFKPVAMTEGFPVLIFVLFGAVGMRSKFARLMWIGAGFLAVHIVCLAVFAILGSAEQYLYWVYFYNLGYTSELSFNRRLEILYYIVGTMGMLWRDWPVMLLAIGGAIFLIARNQNRRMTLFSLAWLFSAAIGTSASGRYAPHYFQQMLPPLAFLAAAGFRGLLDVLPEHKVGQTRRWIAVTVVLVLTVAYPVVAQGKLYFQGPRFARTIYGLNPFFEGEAIGSYLRDQTEPDDTVYILGSEPQFLFYADRKHASRVLFAHQFTGRHPRALDLQKEVFEEIRNARPKYILEMKILTSLFLNDQSPRYLFENLEALFKQEYTYEASLVALSNTRTALQFGHAPPKDKRIRLNIMNIYRRK